MKRRRWLPDAERLALVIALVAALVLTAQRARAETKVSVHYESQDQLEVARRLSSELASEGYGVELTSEPGASPCDPGDVERAPASPPSSVWIRLRAAGPSNELVVASICYLGALPFLQQVTASAPRSEPEKLALSTAEALNGLRARIPPLESGSGAPRPKPPAPVTAAKPAPAASVPAPVKHSPNSASLGPALFLNLPDFPAALGVEARATPAAASDVELTLDVFVPGLGSELASESVTATARTTWLRLGPRFQWTRREIVLSSAFVAGPAFTWATAVAREPRAGRADIAPGAVVSLVQYAEYPARTSWFGSATVSASALLPGARVKLWDDEPSPRGSFPVVASVGFGTRFGW